MYMQWTTERERVCVFVCVCGEWVDRFNSNHHIVLQAGESRVDYVGCALQQCSVLHYKSYHCHYTSLEHVGGRRLVERWSRWCSGSSTMSNTTQPIANLPADELRV